MTHERFKTQILPHHADMYRLAYRIIRNADDASDLVQDTFVQLWAHRDELDTIDNPKAYCLTAIRNRCATFMRRLHQTTTIDCLQGTLAVAPHDGFEHRDEVRLLEQIIRILPQNHQTVIKLSTFAQCSNEEIAEMTGLTDANVRTILSRSRRKIKELFSKHI